MRILMVCLGNICRSPMAEGVLKHLAAQRGLTITVDSAGTSGFHVGEMPDSRAINCMKGKGIDITYQRARKLHVSDFDNFDRIYAMDESNYRDILDYAHHPSQRSKVKMILNEIYPNQNISVPDPYYGGEYGFEEVYNMLLKACNKICDDIQNQ